MLRSLLEPSESAPGSANPYSNEVPILYICTYILMSVDLLQRRAAAHPPIVNAKRAKLPAMVFYP